jgi:hypothetical protein
MNVGPVGHVNSLGFSAFRMMIPDSNNSLLFCDTKSESQCRYNFPVAPLWETTSSAQTHTHTPRGRGGFRHEFDRLILQVEDYVADLILVSAGFDAGVPVHTHAHTHTHTHTHTHGFQF